MSLQTVAVIQYPNGHLGNLTHRPRWRWLAAVLEWIYWYGPAFMPLAGGAHVIDVYTVEVP